VVGLACIVLVLVSFLQCVRGGVTTADMCVCVCVCVCDGLCMVAVQLYLRAEHVVFGSYGLWPH
jgi:hypothetical protein